MQLAADAGGMGAVAGVGVNLLKTWTTSRIQEQRAKLDAQVKATEIENANGWDKLKLQAPDVASFVIRFLVVCSMFVWTSPVWAPLMGMFTDKTIGCVWYWPTDWKFFFFEWSKLRELHFGPENPDIEIGVLPSHLAGANNIISFYFINRVFKRK